MKNKFNITSEDPTDLLTTLTQMISLRDYSRFFGSKLFEEKEKYPHERLGDGYELREIEIKDEKGNIIDNRNKYSHLYHNDLKVSEEVFRKGGMGGNFKYGYCSLIHYTQKKPHSENKHGFDYGTHVIINELGDIKMKGGGVSDYPNHIGGHLGSLGNYIYDLRTGEPIAPKSSTTISGMNCIIVEHKYDWYDKEVKLPLGVYRIDFKTAEITKIDEVK
jgi:hypothetical protein